MEATNEKEVNDALPVDQSAPNFIQPEVKASPARIFLILLIVTLIGAGGAFWFIQSKKINVPVEAFETKLDTTKTNQVPEVVENVAVKEKYVTPAGYRKIEEPQLGISFDVPTNWKKGQEPESGIASYATENFSSKRMKILGAYIAYDVYSAPEGYKGTSDEYLNLLKSSLRWNEIEVDGYKVLISNSEWTNQPGSINTKIIGKIGNKFLDIHFMDEKGSNQEQFDIFLKSLDLP